MGKHDHLLSPDQNKQERSYSLAQDSIAYQSLKSPLFVVKEEGVPETVVHKKVISSKYQTVLNSIQKESEIRRLSKPENLNEILDLSDRPSITISNKPVLKHLPSTKIMMQIQKKVHRHSLPVNVKIPEEGQQKPLNEELRAKLKLSGIRPLDNPKKYSLPDKIPVLVPPPQPEMKERPKIGMKPYKFPLGTQD